MRRRFLPSWVFLVAIAASSATFSRCATTTAPPRDAFPLDPREGLRGPFDEAIARGWKALLAGNTVEAESEFRRAAASKEGSSSRAGAIGTIETLVLSRR